MRSRAEAILGRAAAQTALVGLLYLAFAIAITWPFALHPQSAIFGVVGADLTGSIGRFQEFVTAGQSPFLPGRMHEVDAPDGVPTTWALDLASFPSTFVFWGLSVAIGAIPANGVLTIAAFTLCAISMFLLARWVTGHAGVAIVVGIAFGFWPWVFSTSSQALGHGWVFVIVIWRALVAFERPTARNGVFLGLAVVLCMTWFQYWILIGGVFYASLAAALLLLAVLRGDGRRQFRAQLAAIGVIAALGLCLGLLAKAATPGEIPIRPASDAYAYSARPLMYVTPHPENPVFGRWTKPFLASRYDGYTAERPAYANIYLGLTMLGMALVGIGWLFRRLRREGRGAFSDRRVAAGIAALVAAVIALLFSGPPRISILGLDVPLPEELVLQASTAFRVTHRFGLVVMLCVCVLAALGLRAILAGRSTAMTTAIVAVLAVAVSLDLWGRQVHGALRVKPPEVYSVLRDEPRGTLAVYPLSPLTDNVAIFFRPAHRKPVFNGFRTGTETHPLKGDLQDLAQPSTVTRLAALGVRYVIVTPGGSQPWQPQPDQRFRGLQFVMGSKDGSLFRVVAKPAPVIVSFASGFFAAEWNPPRFLRWMTAPEATIELRGNCDPCVGRVQLTAASLAQDRVLRFTDKQGELIAIRRVRATPTAISFPVRFRGRVKLTLGTLPGPQLISEATGTADYRRVSIQFEAPMSFVSTRKGDR